MTIAVACNLADGVVIGTDSAVTIEKPGSQSRVYSDGIKVFTVKDRPLGMATWGLASIEGRTIRSYIVEFETTRAEQVQQSEIGDVAKALRQFLNAKFIDGMKAAGTVLAPDDRAVLGLLVAGFSKGAYLSEVWDIRAEQDDEKLGVTCIMPRGTFSAAWRGLTDGIERLMNGVGTTHAQMIYDIIHKHQPLKQTPEMIQEIVDALDSWRYRIRFNGMPLQEGVDYVRFLLDVMINHSRFVDGAFGCGGPVRIVVVQEDGVRHVTSHDFRLSH